MYMTGMMSISNMNWSSVLGCDSHTPGGHVERFSHAVCPYEICVTRCWPLNASMPKQFVTTPWALECFSINTRRLHRTSSTTPNQLFVPSMTTMMLVRSARRTNKHHHHRHHHHTDLEERQREPQREAQRAFFHGDRVHDTVNKHLSRCQSCVTKRGVTTAFFRMTLRRHLCLRGSWKRPLRQVSLHIPWKPKTTQKPEQPQTG